MSSPLPPTTAAALSLHGLFKTYGATRALDGVDLTIKRGEAVALMGANGAGKSTLAKIASGVVKPDQGRIVVAGREVRLVFAASGARGRNRHRPSIDRSTWRSRADRR
jgi:ABC-type sugar transport system ATPase subunit